MAETRLKIAVFIDFDNIEIGVKTTLNAPFDIGAVLEAVKERGEVITKVAYGDWQRSGDYSRQLSQHAIRLVQRNLTPGGDKNGADINLALDALEMAFTHDHINAFVIVGGDSDFITLVEKLKQYDKEVFVVGGRAFTSAILQRNCSEFIAYENLVRRSAGRGRAPATEGQLSQAFPLVRRALKVLTDREVTAQLGLLKSTLLQLDSTFSERSYGAGSFRDFMEKLEKAGLVTLKQVDRSVLVELKDGEPAGDEAAAHVQAHVQAPGQVPAPKEHGGHRQEPLHEPRHERPAEDAVGAEESSVPPERLAEGVRAIQQLFRTARISPRFPMYLRNVKQFARNVDPTFDERHYGFKSLIDLLRVCQRDGFFRLERDRRGGLRVHPGHAYQQSQGATPGAEGSVTPAPMPDVDESAADVAAAVSAAAEYANETTSPRDDDQAAAGAEPTGAVDVEPAAAQVKPKRARRASTAKSSATAAAKKPRARRASSRKTQGAGPKA